MRIHPVAYGFDSLGPPNAIRAHDLVRPQAMLQWVLEHTNLRIAGGYTSIAAWDGVLEPVWGQGFGLSIFDNSARQQTSWWEDSLDGGLTWRAVTGVPGAPSQADGATRAARIEGNARAQAPHLARSVVFLDNEDAAVGTSISTATTQTPDTTQPQHLRRQQVRRGFTELLEYYRGLLDWLEQQPPTRVHIRPGMYAHLWIARALLPEYPYLYLCDVQHERGFDTRNGSRVNPAVADDVWDRDFNEQLDPDSHARTRDRVDFRSSAHNALPAHETDRRGRPIPATNGRRGPGRPWLAWPSLFQWDGQTRAPLGAARETVIWPRPPRAGQPPFGIEFPTGQSPSPFGVLPTPPGVPPTKQLMPNANWFVDYESALVEDPAFPAASPRLALTGTVPPILAAVRVEPPPAVPTREGRRRVQMLQPNPPAAGAGVPLVQYAPEAGVVCETSRPQWLESGMDVFLATPRRVGFELQLEIHRLVAGVLQPAGNGVFIPPNNGRIPFAAPWAAAARAPDDAHLFAVAEDGTLFTTHGDPTQPWPALVPHGSSAVHQYSEIVASVRGGTNVDVFFVGADRALHTAWWNPARAWPGQTDYRIGAVEQLLPTSALAALSPHGNAVLVFGVGFDLRLRVASWAPGSWVGPTPVGGPSELLAAHTRLAAAWNQSTGVCEVLAIDNDLHLCLYAVGSNGRAWSSVGPRTTIFSPVPDPVTQIAPSAPNPFGDVCLRMVDGRRVAVAVFAEAGGGVARFATCPLTTDPVARNWTRWEAL